MMGVAFHSTAMFHKHWFLKCMREQMKEQKTTQGFSVQGFDRVVPIESYGALGRMH